MPKKEPITFADKLYNLRYEKEVQLKWVDEAIDEVDKLDDYDKGFVYSIKEQLMKNKILTEKQIDKLEQIYNKI